MGETLGHGDRTRGVVAPTRAAHAAARCAHHTTLAGRPPRATDPAAPATVGPPQGVEVSGRLARRSRNVPLSPGGTVGHAGLRTTGAPAAPPCARAIRKLDLPGTSRVRSGPVP